MYIIIVILHGIDDSNINRGFGKNYSHITISLECIADIAPVQRGTAVAQGVASAEKIMILFSVKIRTTSQVFWTAIV